MLRAGWEYATPSVRDDANAAFQLYWKLYNSCHNVTPFHSRDGIGFLHDDDAGDVVVARRQTRRRLSEDFDPTSLLLFSGGCSHSEMTQSRSESAKINEWKQSGNTDALRRRPFHPQRKFKKSGCTGIMTITPLLSVVHSLIACQPLFLIEVMTLVTGFVWYLLRGFSEL